MLLLQSVMLLGINLPCDSYHLCLLICITDSWAYFHLIRKFAHFLLRQIRTETQAATTSYSNRFQWEQFRTKLILLSWCMCVIMLVFLLLLRYRKMIFHNLATNKGWLTAQKAPNIRWMANDALHCGINAMRNRGKRDSAAFVHMHEIQILYKPHSDRARRKVWERERERERAVVFKVGLREISKPGLAFCSSQKYVISIIIYGQQKLAHCNI